MRRSIQSLMVVTVLTAGAPLEAADPYAGPLGELTLEDAVSLALQHNPLLAAGTQALSAADARVVQAGLLPNPELEIEVENFGGSADLGGFESAESTAVISQPILLGGKRSRSLRRIGRRSPMSCFTSRRASRTRCRFGSTPARFRPWSQPGPRSRFRRPASA